MAFNGFHGNDYLNMSYQVKMAFLGISNFASLYIEETTIVTDDNLSIDDADDVQPRSIDYNSEHNYHIKLIVRSVFSGSQRYVMGEEISLQDI